MVGEVFNEEDEENDSDEEDMAMSNLKKRQESIAICVTNEETTPKDIKENNKLNTSDMSGELIKIGNGSDKSDNLNDSNDHNMSQVSGDDINNISQINDEAEAETENMSSNMLSASIEVEEDKVEHLQEEGVLIEAGEN